MSRSNGRTGHWFTIVFAVLFTLLTPLSLAYPASFAIGGMYIYAFTHNPSPFAF